MNYLTKQTSTIFLKYFKEQNIVSIDQFAFDLGVERAKAKNWIEGWEAPGIRDLTRIKSQFHDWRHTMAGELGDVILKDKQEKEFRAKISHE